MSTRLPAKGVPRDELFAAMGERKKQDADWRGGRTWSLVYPAGEEVDALLHTPRNVTVHDLESSVPDRVGPKGAGVWARTPKSTRL